MSNPAETTWDWFKTAPLPVVLALVLALATWTYSIADDADKAAAIAQLAKERVEDAKKSVEKLDDKLEKANDKLDRLLAAVASLKQQVQDKAGDKAGKK